MTRYGYEDRDKRPMPSPRARPAATPEERIRAAPRHEARSTEAGARGSRQRIDPDFTTRAVGVEGPVRTQDLALWEEEGVPGGIGRLLGRLLAREIQCADAVELDVANDLLVIKLGEGTLRDAAGVLVRLGNYTEAASALTNESDTWSAGDDPDGTADGKNELTLGLNKTAIVAQANRLAIALDISGGAAYDGRYTLTFKIHHDTTNYLGYSGPPEPDGDSFVSTVTVRYQVDGGAWQDGPQAELSDLVVEGTSTQEYQVELDIGDNSPTSVTIELRLSTTMQVDPSRRSGSLFSQVRVYDATGIGTDPYGVTWEATAGGTLSRRGMKIYARAGKPHMTLEPLATLPADADGVEGELCYVTGAGLYHHNGTAWTLL